MAGVTKELHLKCNVLAISNFIVSNLNNYMRFMATMRGSLFPFQGNTDVLLHFLFPSPFF